MLMRHFRFSSGGRVRARWRSWTRPRSELHSHADVDLT